MIQLSYIFLCCYQLPRNHWQLNGFCAATGNIQSSSQYLTLCRFLISSVLQKCHTKEMPLTSLDCVECSSWSFAVTFQKFNQIKYFFTHTQNSLTQHQFHFFSMGIRAALLSLPPSSQNCLVEFLKFICL